MSSYFDEKSQTLDDKLASQSRPPTETFDHWLPACLIGCLAIGLVATLLCAGIGWYVFSQAKTIASNLAREAIVTTVRQSELDGEEKQAIIAQVDRVVQQYQAGEISTEDVGRIMQALAESPLMGAILVASVEAKYIDPSGLSDAEKQDARRTLQRVLRGMYEEKLTMDDLEPAMDHVSEIDSQGNRQLKDRISDDELRGFLEACQQQVDDAQVPDEPYEVQISQELQRAIDRALNTPSIDASPDG